MKMDTCLNKSPPLSLPCAGVFSLISVSQRKRDRGRVLFWPPPPLPQVKWEIKMFVHKTGFTKHRLLNKISYILLFQSRLWFCVYLALHIAEKIFRHIFFTCKKKYDLSILKTLVLISIWIHMSYLSNNLNKIYMYRVRTALLIIFCNISTFFGMRELTSTGIYYLKIKCNDYWLPHKN